MAIGRCDLDYYTIKGVLPFPAPFAIGHEIVGEIVEIGSSVEHFAVGQKVAVPCNVNCGSCKTCQRELTARCETTQGAGYGVPSAFGGAYGGGLSDLIIVPFADSMLVSIPDHVDPVSVACLGDNISDGYRAVGPYLEQDPDQSVLVVGGISVGLYAAAIAKALGCERVDYMDRRPHHLEMAEAMGINAIDAQIDGPINEKYRIVVDASARVEGLDYALKSLEPGGICTCTGTHFNDAIPIPYMTMYQTDATLKVGLTHSRAVMDKALQLVIDGKFKPELVTTTLLPFEDVADHYGMPSTKLVVTR